MTKQTRLFLAEYEQKVMNLPPELKEYTIESMLHESANGATYRLVKDDGTRAVLKVRPLSKKELLKDEAKILQSLDADGHMAPRLYLSFTDEQYAFLVREFLEGVTLEEYYEKHGDLSEDALCFIGQSLCLCVAGLQEQKPPIIHRDIKPQNCILTPDGQIRLMDFDTARTYKDKQDSDTRFLGTKTTAAPEQYGFAQSDVRTDL
ncbi:MAG: phosphotransferase, partial [Lachnospiraceae bacterium]|nr:phosphotransferase [Lachnospiraceae bacterium]